MKLILVPLILTLFIVGCAPNNKISSEHGGRDEAVANAIRDFSKLGRIYSRDSVFSVTLVDTVWTMILDKTVDRQVWNLGRKHESLLAVRIGATYEPFLLDQGAVVGSKGRLPSRTSSRMESYFIGGMITFR